MDKNVYQLKNEHTIGRLVTKDEILIVNHYMNRKHSISIRET